MSTNQFYLSLGSNLGDREFFLHRAIEELRNKPQISLAHFSSIYETDPVGYLEQDPFLNMVLCGQTTLTAKGLLAVIQQIELDLGRERMIRFGPRTIDIDILLYNNKVIDHPELTIPHPRMRERAFVMIPLAEIAPQLTLPGETREIGKLIESFSGEGVRKWTSKLIHGASVSAPLGN